MPDTTPTHLAGWQLHDNRHATLWIDAVARNLRPPTMGEFRKVRDDTQAAHETIAAMAVAAEARRQELEPLLDAGQVKFDDAQAELQMLSDEIVDHTHATHWGLLRGVIERLSGSALPPDDELPPWLIENAATGLGDLVTHWRSVPPRLGVG